LDGNASDTLDFIENLCYRGCEPLVPRSIGDYRLELEIETEAFTHVRSSQLPVLLVGTQFQQAISPLRSESDLRTARGSFTLQQRPHVTQVRYILESHRCDHVPGSCKRRNQTIAVQSRQRLPDRCLTEPPRRRYFVLGELMPRRASEFDDVPLEAVVCLVHQCRALDRFNQFRELFHRLLVSSVHFSADQISM